MDKELFTTDKTDTIRRHWDPKSGTWYFSVVDIIAIVTKSADARNYWKVLKNRLKKTNNELVTNCNQLKLLATDGKSYLTDTADADTTVQIIETIAPGAVKPLRRWLDNIVSQTATQTVLRPANDDEAELTIDMHETDSDLVIHSMIPGIAIDELIISIDYQTLTIQGNRIDPSTISGQAHVPHYTTQELYWGPFSRTIQLPALIEVSGAHATEQRGLLIITLPKLNTAHTRIIKPKLL